MTAGERFRTVVTFESSAFNTTVPKDYFVNERCFGDDLTRSMRERLHVAGLHAEEPGQEDFGWYLPFTAGTTAYLWIVTYRPCDCSDPGTWIGWIERRGLYALLRRTSTVRAEAVEAIHDTLSGAPMIQSVRWHFDSDFSKDKQRLSAGSSPHESGCEPANEPTAMLRARAGLLAFCVIMEGSRPRIFGS